MLQDEERGLEEDIVELGRRVEMKGEELNKVKNVLNSKKELLTKQNNELEA